MKKRVADAEVFGWYEPLREEGLYWDEKHHPGNFSQLGDIVTIGNETYIEKSQQIDMFYESKDKEALWS